LTVDFCGITKEVNTITRTNALMSDFIEDLIMID